MAPYCTLGSWRLSKYRFGSGSLSFCCLYSWFLCSTGNWRPFPCIGWRWCLIGCRLVTFDCFGLGLSISFLFILVSVRDDCLYLDLSPKVSLGADMWIKFCFSEVDLDWGCFSAVLLARNCFLVEVDVFSVSWKGNEHLDVDWEVRDFLNADARHEFDKTDGDALGRISVNETWFDGCFNVWAWACFNTACTWGGFVFLFGQVN